MIYYWWWGVFLEVLHRDFMGFLRHEVARSQPSQADDGLRNARMMRRIAHVAAMVTIIAMAMYCNVIIVG